VLDDIELGLAIVLVGLTLWRLPYAVRQPRHRPLCRWFAGMAFGMVLVYLPFAQAVDRVTGVPNLSTLLKHLAVVYGDTAMLDVVRAVAGHARPPATSWRQVLASRRRYTLASIVTAVIMTALFIATPRHHEVANYLTAYENTPQVTAYWIVWLGLLGAALWQTNRMNWRAAAYGRSPMSLRTGLWLLAAGSFIGLCYVAQRMAFTLTHAIGWRVMGNDSATLITNVLLVVTLVLLVIGTCTQAVAVRVAALRDARAWRDLRPLWDALRAAVPEAALAVADDEDAATRLHRRVIEIRDAMIALRDFLTEDIVAAAREAATGVAADHRAATLTALELAGAARAKLRGRLAAARAELDDRHPPDLASEVAWLRAVTRATRSRTVRETAERLWGEARMRTGDEG
jgi:hypothetical protein